MNYYRVIFQPHGSHDKEWTVWTAANREEVHKQFNRGIIINIIPTTEEEYKNYCEDC